MPTPRWRQLLDASEQRLAPQVDQIVRSSAFANAVKVGIELRRTVEARIEPYSRSILHALNLPTASDVRRLQRQLADLDRELRAQATPRAAAPSRKVSGASTPRARAR